MLSGGGGNFYDKQSNKWFYWYLSLRELVITDSEQQTWGQMAKEISFKHSAVSFRNYDTIIAL